MLWTDGSVPFRFGKGGFGVLSFSAGTVCSSFSAEACAILHSLYWSRQHQQVCHFLSFLLLSGSRSILATLSFPPSFLLSQTFWQIWQELSSLSSCSIRLQWVRGYSFLSRLMSWLDGKRYLRLLQSLVVSLLSLISTLLFSCTGGVLSHLNSSTHRFPRHARCVLSFSLQWTQATVELLSL